MLKSIFFSGIAEEFEGVLNFSRVEVCCIPLTETVLEHVSYCEARWRGVVDSMKCMTEQAAVRRYNLSAT